MNEQKRNRLIFTRINMAHAVDHAGVIFRQTDASKNNALDQLESELQRIVREEVEAALRARQVRREEEQRDG